MPSSLQYLHPFTTTPARPSVTMAAAEIMPSLANELALREMATAAKYHNHVVGPHQCCSAAVRRIAAPVATVWSVVRQFDQPQTYKQFLRSCRLIAGDSDHVGCLRLVEVVSGLPAASSTERLEVLDDVNHAVGFSVVGGDHRLQNYRSVMTLHPTVEDDGGTEGTVVVESYMVDVPPGNTKEETCTFVETIVRCNLQSLSLLAEGMARSSSSLSSSSSKFSDSSSSSSCKVS